MFATQRPPDHAIHTEVLIVKLPQAHQIVDDRLLLSPTSEFRYIARILNHTDRIEPRAKPKYNRKKQIQYRMERICG